MKYMIPKKHKVKGMKAAAAVRKQGFNDLVHGQWLLLVQQKPFGFKGGFAARGGSGDGLTEVRVLHVAGGKYAVHTGGGAVGLGDDVALRVQLDLPRKQLGDGRVSDGHENAVHREGAQSAAVLVSDGQARDGLHEAPFLADDFGGDAVPDDLDVRRVEDALLHRLGGAELVAAVHQIDLVAQFGEIGGLLQGGVAATDDGHVLAAEEVAVAGGAGRNAEAAVGLLAFEAQPTCRRTCRYDDRFGQNLLGVIDHAAEGAFGKIHLRHHAGAHVGAAAQRLLADVVHDGRPGHPFRVSRKILHLRGDGKLSARLRAFNQYGFQIGA